MRPASRAQGRRTPSRASAGPRPPQRGAPRAGYPQLCPQTECRSVARKSSRPSRHQRRGGGAPERILTREPQAAHRRSLRLAVVRRLAASAVRGAPRRPVRCRARPPWRAPAAYGCGRAAAVGPRRAAPAPGPARARSSPSICSATGRASWRPIRRRARGCRCCRGTAARSRRRCPGSSSRGAALDPVREYRRWPSTGAPVSPAPSRPRRPGARGPTAYGPAPSTAISARAATAGGSRPSPRVSSAAVHQRSSAASSLGRRGPLGAPGARRAK